MPVTPVTDISIGIETLSTRLDAAILSVGAQAFDRKTGKLHGTFYQEINVNSALRSGKIDGATLLWWMDKSPSARELLQPDNPDNPRKLDLASTLLNLNTWVRTFGAPRVWGNGATFDISILEYAYMTGCVGLSAPWGFRNIRDVRTIVEAAEDFAAFDRNTVKSVGVHHNALDDATYQANLIFACMQALRGGKAKPAPAKKPVVVPDDDDEL